MSPTQNKLKPEPIQPHSGITTILNYCRWNLPLESPWVSRLVSLKLPRVSEFNTDLILIVFCLLFWLYLYIYIHIPWFNLISWISVHKLVPGVKAGTWSIGWSSDCSSLWRGRFGATTGGIYRGWAGGITRIRWSWWTWGGGTSYRFNPCGWSQWNSSRNPIIDVGLGDMFETNGGKPVHEVPSQQTSTDAESPPSLEATVSQEKKP